MLPPYELKNKDFSKVMRGYNPAEVDEHFAFIIEKYTELYRENDELERKLKTAYARLDEIKNEEESIRNAMVNAQRASAKIMTEANDRADIIINTARKSCDRILSDFKKKIQEERAILSALNTSITEFKEKLFKLYNSHISYVDGIELLDENEIIKYALSDENYTSAVIQNIKQDILNMASEEPAETTETNADGFVEADSTKDGVIRSTNIKDTIKELNKRIVEEAEETAITSPDQTAGENEAEAEYSEMLKQLGAESPVDIPEKDNDLNKIFETPKNYGEIIKRKFKK